MWSKSGVRYETALCWSRGQFCGHKRWLSLWFYLKTLDEVTFSDSSSTISLSTNNRIIFSQICTEMFKLFWKKSPFRRLIAHVYSAAIVSHTARHHCSFLSSGSFSRNCCINRQLREKKRGRNQGNQNLDGSRTTVALTVWPGSLPKEVDIQNAHSLMLHLYWHTWCSAALFVPQVSEQISVWKCFDQRSAHPFSWRTTKCQWIWILGFNLQKWNQ